MDIVEGRVVIKGTDRWGVSGAVVEAFLDGANSRNGSARRLGSVVTDSDGHFSIDYQRPDCTREQWALRVDVRHHDGGESTSGALASCTRDDPAPRETLLIGIEREQLTKVGLAPGRPQAQSAMANYEAAKAHQGEIAAQQRRFLADDLRAERSRQLGVDQHFDRFVTALSNGAGGREGRRYVAADARVDDAVTAAIRDGIADRFNQSTLAGRRTFTQREIQALRRKYPRLTNIDAADIDRRAGGRVPPTHQQMERRDPLGLCRRQTPINDCVKILDPGSGQEDGRPDDELEQGKEVDAQQGEPDAQNSTVDAIVNRLTASITSPESKVVVDLRPPSPMTDPTGRVRAEPGDVQASVDGFALRGGPADVPAVHDFHHLTVAFESVWQELFNKNVLETGRELYDKFVELGLDPNEYLISDSGELKAAAIKAMKKQVAKKQTTTYAEPRIRVIEWFAITDSLWSRLSQGQQDQLWNLAGELTGLSEDIINLTHDIEDLQKTVQLDFLKEFMRVHYRSKIEERRRAMRAYQMRGEKIVKYAKEKTQDPSEFELFHELLNELEQSIKEPYRFNVYAAQRTGRSINFGVMATYRQRWTPVAYQVGELVRTVPLGPKEVRKYSRRTVRKENRSQKESQSHVQSLRTESSVTARVEAEIISRAEKKTNFQVGAEGGIESPITFKATSSFGANADQFSQETKKEFRESVFKAASEYKAENRVEVEVGNAFEFTDDESGELSNPNDELSVTFLFYELQRRYRIDEQLRKVTPVILVAQEFPRPNEIDDDWIVAHDWILRRVILDDSFIPAMDYLCTKVVGDEHALEEMYANLQQQRRMVDALTEEVTALRSQLDMRYEALQRSMQARAAALEEDNSEGFYESAVEFFIGEGESDPEAGKAREDAARDAYQRVVDQERELKDRLQRETTALADLTDKYTTQLSEHLNRRTQISRLRVHIKANIMHYMQAIYSHEPPDQRYFRLRDVKVPRLVGTKTYSIVTDPNAIPVPPTWQKPHKLVAKVNINTNNLRFDSLGDIADLDNPLGFKGNYMVFRLTRENALTDYMMTPYYDPFTGLRDPDQLANWTLHDFAEYVCCLRKNASERTFSAMLPGLIEAYRRLKEADDGDDELVVPTGSLYIEALPGAHPILEDFKLAHRAIDVKKAQAEARLGELENLRMAARLLAGEREDPRIDKKIIVEGNPKISIDQDKP